MTALLQLSYPYLVHKLARFALIALLSTETAWATPPCQAPFMPAQERQRAIQEQLVELGAKPYAIPHLIQKIDRAFLKSRGNSNSEFTTVEISHYTHGYLADKRTAKIRTKNVIKLVSLSLVAMAGSSAVVLAIPSSKEIGPKLLGGLASAIVVSLGAKISWSLLGTLDSPFTAWLTNWGYRIFNQGINGDLLNQAPSGRFLSLNRAMNATNDFVDQMVINTLQNYLAEANQHFFQAGMAHAAGNSTLVSQQLGVAAVRFHKMFAWLGADNPDVALTVRAAFFNPDGSEGAPELSSYLEPTLTWIARNYPEYQAKSDETFFRKLLGAWLFTTR